MYKLIIWILKQRWLRRFTDRLGISRKSQYNFDRERVIKKYSNGKTFADIGCMWGIHGKYSFLAEESGAKKVIGVDMHPESDEYLEEKKRRVSSVQFIQGDINSLDTIEKLSEVDIVFCTGVIYHMPNPLLLLFRLRMVCKQILIIGSALIPEMVGMDNVAIFYPYLNENQRKTWSLGIGLQKGVTGPYEAEAGYGNWFWGLTPSCIRSMLKISGFEVIESSTSPFNGLYVCQPKESNFLARSDKWITKQDNEFLKFLK